MKEGSKCKRQTHVNQQIDIVEDCSGIELNGKSLEIVEKFVILVAQ